TQKPPKGGFCISPIYVLNFCKSTAMKKSKKSAMEKAKAKEAKLIAKLAKKATGKASKNAIVTQGYTTIPRAGKVVRVNDKGEVIATLGNIDR
ncbi:MAG: hypothetical protein QG627_916, partial [Chlamydiota bacterium]|nr:hypothetical protein [Chlamydiota bacterium]